MNASVEKFNEEMRRLIEKNEDRRDATKRGDPKDERNFGRRQQKVTEFKNGIMALPLIMCRCYIGLSNVLTVSLNCPTRMWMLAQKSGS